MLMLSSFAFLLPVNATIERLPMPRMDEAYLRVISDPDAATTAFQTGEADFYPDMIRQSNIQKLISEGHSVLSMGGFHMCYLGLNTRDYVPDDFSQPDAGRPLAPMNYTAFRQALAWAGPSNAEKAAHILTIYGGPVNQPLGTVVPPALGVWHDPTVPTPGGNFTKAEELLLAGGFTVVAGELVQPNGVVARADQSKEIHVLSPVEAPTSVSFTQVFVDAWNNFTQVYLGVDLVFIHDVIPFGTEIQHAFYWRNFDVYFLCWGLGRFADYLFDFFHSSQEGIDQNNTPGIDNATLDGYLEDLKYGLVYADKITAAHDAQNLIVTELVPYVCIYSRTYYNAFANRIAGGQKLVNMVNQGGFGADNFWTWTLMHWNTSLTGGSFTHILGASLDDLHPGWASSAYEFDVLGAVLDGLIAVTPALGDLPWVAGSWTVEPFDWAPLNIYDGTAVTFQLRDDVYWHDGEKVTVDDVKFAFEFMVNFPGLNVIWEHLAWVEVLDPCTIRAYMNVTSQYILYDLAGVALWFPEHIYSHAPVAGPYAGADPTTAPVWEITYSDWQGYAAPVYPFMTQEMKALIGSGPYVFDYYDPTTDIAHVVKFPLYFIDEPIKQNFIAPQRIDPGAELEYYFELINAGSKVGFDLAPATIDWVDLTVDDVIVATFIGPLVLDPFTASGLIGPYYHTFVTKGLHWLDCHTYEEGTIIDEYIFPIYVTIAEDVNYDYVVDIFDIVILGLAFGSSPGDANWDSRGDLVKDFVIDIFDIVKIALNFGWA